MRTNTIVIFLFTVLFFVNPVKAQDYKLWYTKPARNWEEALPVGNGRLGAMFFGGVKTDRLQLNEESVWTKGPQYKDKEEGWKAIPQIQELLFQGKYTQAEALCREKILGDRQEGSSTYQTLGDLMVQFEGIESFSDYSRELNIQNAVAKSEFRSGGTVYTRQIFASAADQCLVYRAEADTPGKISCTIELSRPGEGENVTANKNLLVMRQHINGGRGVRYETQVKVIPSGGKVIPDNNRIVVVGADKVELRIVAATDYRGINPSELCNACINLSRTKKFKRLLQDHLKDYQKLYNRVQLTLPASANSELPTDRRLQAVKEGLSDPQLAALYFQYGRYLLISSSREGCLPANLQGIWNEELHPPWFSDYHFNMNTPMNYWLAEVSNLSELHLPLLEYISELRERGRKTAKEVYGVNGFVAHHRSDVWHFTSPYGDPHYGMWPMGAAWLSTHYWEHYRFGGDTKYLKEVGYPVMREAAQFVSGFMVKHPETGKWVIGPSSSPENVYVTPATQRGSVVMGSAMDLQIIDHLFRSVIQASELLNLDQDFRKTLQNQLEGLTEVKIGRDGRILEWNNEQLTEADPGHRHLSHLYGLYPSDKYTWNETPEYMLASEKVIEYRKKHFGNQPGWTRAWMINLYARLLKPEKAWDVLENLWINSTQPNLFNEHPPFQIDGNFGAAAGIAEMLIQSHTGAINLLPCIPREWHTGSVRGLVARGGFEIDMSWRNNRLEFVKVKSLRGNRCLLKHGSKKRLIRFEKGETVMLNENLAEITP